MAIHRGLALLGVRLRGLVLLGVRLRGGVHRGGVHRGGVHRGDSPQGFLHRAGWNRGWSHRGDLHREGYVGLSQRILRAAHPDWVRTGWNQIVKDARYCRDRDWKIDRRGRRVGWTSVHHRADPRSDHDPKTLRTCFLGHLHFPRTTVRRPRFLRRSRGFCHVGEGGGWSGGH